MSNVINRVKHIVGMWGGGVSTSPQKREPMTGSEISQGFISDKGSTNAESYWAGVALAEKHYRADKI